MAWWDTDDEPVVGIAEPGPQQPVPAVCVLNSSTKR
jgi:hypothetical protein